MWARPRTESRAGDGQFCLGPVGRCGCCLLFVSLLFWSRPSGAMVERLIFGPWCWQPAAVRSSLVQGHEPNAGTLVKFNTLQRPGNLLQTAPAQERNALLLFGPGAHYRILPGGILLWATNGDVPAGPFGCAILFAYFRLTCPATWLEGIGAWKQTNVSLFPWFACFHWFVESLLQFGRQLGLGLLSVCCWLIAGFVCVVNLLWTCCSCVVNLLLTCR